MNHFNKFFAVLFSALLFLGVAACEKGTGEKAGEAVDDAVDATKDAVSDAADATEDAASDAADATSDAVDDVKDKMSN